jgi:hypothetical protein
MIMVVTWAASSRAVSSTKPREVRSPRLAGLIVTEERWANVGFHAGSVVFGGLAARSCPRACSSRRRIRWFSSVSSRLRLLETSSRRSNEDSVVRCRAGIGELGVRLPMAHSRWISALISGWV